MCSFLWRPTDTGECVYYCPPKHDAAAKERLNIVILAERDWCCDVFNWTNRRICQRTRPTVICYSHVRGRLDVNKYYLDMTSRARCYDQRRLLYRRVCRLGWFNIWWKANFKAIIIPLFVGLNRQTRRTAKGEPLNIVFIVVFSQW